MNISVLIPYYRGRRELLERSLWLLRHQSYGSPYEVWILDDGSPEEERIEELCTDWIRYHRVRDPGAAPRSSNTAWNRGFYDLAEGEFVILTHPEYLAPRDAIERMVAAYDGEARLGPTAYALSPGVTRRIDEWPWKENLDSLQEAPGFWTYHTPWGWENRAAINWCHHFAFTGQTREAWEITNFIPVTEEFQMNDSWMVVEEQRIGRLPKPVGFSVYHQHHPRRADKPPEEQSARVRRINEARLD